MNDYHLLLVPSMLRELIPNATIGFFLHIPFPSSEIFRCLHGKPSRIHHRHKSEVFIHEFGSFGFVTILGTERGLPAIEHIPFKSPSSSLLLPFVADIFLPLSISFLLLLSPFHFQSQPLPLFFFLSLVRKQILHGLLGSDLIGFQTYSFMRHFLMTTTRLLAYESTPKGIQMENTVVSVGIFPIGINTASLQKKTAVPEVSTIVTTLKEKYAGKKLIIGRDKNDYVKGVRQKFLAFEMFLDKYAEWRGKVRMLLLTLV